MKNTIINSATHKLKCKNAKKNSQNSNKIVKNVYQNSKFLFSKFNLQQ